VVDGGEDGRGKGREGSVRGRGFCSIMLTGVDGPECD